MKGKVQIFWEGHKFEKNLPLIIWRYSLVSNFKWKIFSNFVAFSEYVSKLYLGCETEGGHWNCKIKELIIALEWQKYFMDSIQLSNQGGCIV